MNKISFFIVVVVIGTIGIIVISNKGRTVKPGNDSSTQKVLSVSTTDKSITPAIDPKSLLNKSGIKNPAISMAIAEQDKKQLKATIRTTKGGIQMNLYSQDTPNTVENFIAKSKSGFYNNLTFHRVEDWVIQGGDPKGNGTGGGTMRTEISDHGFITGSVGVARGSDIKVSNDAQFFITKKPSAWLDKQYTNFGMVIKGMEVVNKIEIGDKILGITIDE